MRKSIATLCMSMVLAGGFVVAPDEAEAGIVVMWIRGTITNALGAPLSGMQVSDGNQTFTTGADGRYQLGEERIADQMITASGPGMERQSRLVTIAESTGENDFALLYSLTLAATPQSFNNDSPKTIRIRVSTRAPSVSCITWTDQFSGTSLPMEVGSTENGLTSWTSDYTVPVERPEGQYVHSAIAKTCASGVALSPSPQKVYVVDSTAPRLNFLAPQPFGNVLGTSQPVILSVDDSDGATDAAGVDSRSIKVVVATVDGSQNDQVLNATYIAPTIRTSAASLVPGKRYRATATVRDYAGNVTQKTAEFLSMRSATISDFSQIGVTITSTSYSEVIPGGTLSATDLYSWDNLVADVGPFSVHLDETLHPGAGVVNVGFSATSAVVAYTIRGVPGPPVKPVESVGVAKASISTNSAGLVDIAAPQQSGRPVGKLTALVPKGADASSVKLQMAANASSAQFPLCTDPTQSPGCSPDPLLTPATISGVARLSTGFPSVGAQITVTANRPIDTSDPQPSLLLGQTISSSDGSFSLLLPGNDESTVVAEANGGFLNVDILVRGDDGSGNIEASGTGLAVEMVTPGVFLPAAPVTLDMVATGHTTNEQPPYSTCGPAEKVIASQLAGTQAGELHSWDGMTSEFRYRRRANSTITRGAAYSASYQGASFATSGSTTVANSIAQTSGLKKEGRYGKVLTVVMEYQEVDHWTECANSSGGYSDSGMPHYYTKSAVRALPGGGIGETLDVSLYDGPVKSREAPYSRVACWPSGGWYDKVTAKGYVYRQAATALNFSYDASSGYDTNVGYAWKFGDAKKAYYLWGDTGLPDSAARIYASSDDNPPSTATCEISVGQNANLVQTMGTTGSNSYVLKSNLSGVVSSGKWAGLGDGSTRTSWPDNGNCWSGGSSCGRSAFGPISFPNVVGFDGAWALKADGTVWSIPGCYEENSPRQLGGISNVISISGIALKSDGTIWEPGSCGAWSQLPLSNVIDAAGGGGEFVAAKSDGTAWYSGFQSVPARVRDEAGLPLTNIVSVAANNGSYFALRGDGALFCWGSTICGIDNFSEPSYEWASRVPVNNVVAVFAGENTNFAIDAAGNLWAWGDNSNGSLGTGSLVYHESSPQLTHLAGVVEVASNRDTVLAITADGHIWGWGWNGYGALGNGRYDYFNPEPLPLIIP